MSDIRDEARRALDGITPGKWIAGYGGGENVVILYHQVADAEFIAAAPELVRGLLAELDRAENKADKQANSAYETGQRDLADECGLPFDTIAHDVREIIRERDLALATIQQVRESISSIGEGAPEGAVLEAITRLLDADGSGVGS